jgi:hypothetical protein
VAIGKKANHQAIDHVTLAYHHFGYLVIYLLYFCFVRLMQF